MFEGAVHGGKLRYLPAKPRQHCLNVSLPNLLNAIDELEEMDYRAALPFIRRLLNDSDKYVRQAAETAVRNLEGTE